MTCGSPNLSRLAYLRSLAIGSSAPRDRHFLHPKDEYPMVQVRLAVLNGEFSPRRISALKIADSGSGKCIGPVSAGAPADSTDRAIVP
ncbi:hypothetical protein CA603_50875 [Paraburkholderia hospita]|nr:hypothetical protein CA603_50875 [Paraburkholderia hospita]